MSRWLRWNESAQILLTLELIGLPATALIGHGVRCLGSIQRDRAGEAAIQRDFSYVSRSRR